MIKDNGNVVKVFHTDSEHGWLAVKTQELKELGIHGKILQYSYIKGKTAYLEEDCDASVYIKAQKEIGVDVKFKRGKFHNCSPIRSYNQYC